MEETETSDLDVKIVSADAESSPSFLKKYGKKILIWGGVAAGIVLGVVLLNRTSDILEAVEEGSEEDTDEIVEIPAVLED